MAKAAQNKSKAISKRAVEGPGYYADKAIGYGKQVLSDASNLPESNVGKAVTGLGAGVGAAVSGLPTAGMMSPAGAAWGGSLASKMYRSLFEQEPDKVADAATTTISQILSINFLSKDFDPAENSKVTNCLLGKLKAGITLTNDSVSRCFNTIGFQSAESAQESLTALTNEINQKVGGDFKKNIPVPETPSTQQPQADRGSPIEALSHKLVDRNYLVAPQSTWTPELDKAFREFIDAGTGTKTMSGGADWNAVAPTLGFNPGLSGALSAVTSLMEKVQTKPYTEAQSPTPTGTQAETAKPAAAPEAAADTLPAILSVMRQEKMIGTHGPDLVNEVKRLNVLIEAAGGVNNAAIVLHKQDPSLAARLPAKLDGPVTQEFVRRNKALFQSIQGAANKVIAKQFGPLMPHDKDKAISKLREGLKSAAVQDQWVKLASQRKDRIRSEIAAEMTVADKITARRIKAKESV